MGTYLSTPVTEKCQESGETKRLAWGVVDMQGWRKSMEDGHVAATGDDDDDDDAQVFGVFDGHGGPEVARFCSLYMVSVLQQQETFGKPEKDDNDEAGELSQPKKSNMGQALVSTFHALDRMIDSSQRRDELIRLRAIKPPLGTRKEADDIPSEVVPVENGTAMMDTSNSNNMDSSIPVDMESVEVTTPVKEEEEEKIVILSPQEEQEDDSDCQAVGKEEAAELDRDMMTDENAPDDDNDEDTPMESSGKVSSMLQRLLNMNVAAGQAVLSGPADTQRTPANTPFRASLEQNGRMICNLPDHPIHAGATAIVAVLTRQHLTVANAGDSRAVLCRNGNTVPLSFDHKPLQDTELARINKAGGFVNNFGRVNGNLNLSRSIGDLKYKQVPGIAPPEQMITAEPDIVQMKVTPDDEFMILACDGIWDCLSNEQAVEYVRSRIDQKTPTEIGVEMLDEIISVDPRVTQGIGGDNMTVMIVDLQPQSRSYRAPNPVVD